MTEEQIAILSDPEFVEAINRATVPRAIGDVIKRVNRKDFGEGVFLFRFYDNWDISSNPPSPAGVRMTTRAYGSEVYAVVRHCDTMVGSRWVAEAADWRGGLRSLHVGHFDNLCDALLASWGVMALTFPSEQ